MHVVKTFKLSSDPHFEAKLIDVVGLHLNPPDEAVALCVDEKSQIQAFDRTQPSLPVKNCAGAPGHVTTSVTAPPRSSPHSMSRRVR